MAKTWKDQKVRNYEAKELWTRKYAKKVIPDKRLKLSEDEVLRQMYGDGGYCVEED